jgi:hypothetical protein
MINLLPEKLELAAVVAAPHLEPFSEPMVAFVKAVSEALLHDPAMRAHPELLAFAHWFRPAALASLQTSFGAKGMLRRPRGVVLHMAPSNVDAMFVYPWFLSLLLGNRNVVRLSQRRGAAVGALLAVITKLLQRDELRALSDRSLVVSYDHDAAITQQLSAACRVRMIWGGDETVRALRAVPLPPSATEIVFSDRFSLAALSAPNVLALDDARLERLARDFCADALWFDQLACSSPRAVVWVGSAAAATAAQARFWPVVEQRAGRYPGLAQPTNVVTRFATACHLAAAHGALRVTQSKLTRVQVERLDSGQRAAHAGAGVFLELCCRDTPALAAQLTEADQTLVHFGFELPALQPCVERGIDRIVPIGEALKFETTWDGIDLLRALTKECVLRG